MNSMTAWIFLATGLVLLVVGGDALVRGAVSVAARLRISPLIVGLTLVGFGTSTPELAASVKAALSGSPDIAVGNVVGSNIANILLILGLSALVRPLLCARNAVKRDGLVAAVAAGLLVGVALFGTVPRFVGAVFLLLLGGDVVATYLIERRESSASADLHRAEAELVVPLPGSTWIPLALVAAGIAGVVIGASMLIDGALVIARAAGISEAVIGLTLVAVGTSLPELTVSIIAAIKRQGDVAFGNIVGSNIFNILGILGITALIQPLAIPAQFVQLDIWVMAAATLAMLAFATTNWRLDRWEGGLFLAFYCAYLWLLFNPGAMVALGLAVGR